jgi:hypothetical protein
VSDTDAGPALVFLERPQDVEVDRGEGWVVGSMVGWRQEDGSTCRVMIRVVERGAERTAWADLHDVRLPEHRSCPPTESLPLVPQLPLGRTEESETGRHHVAVARGHGAPVADPEPTRLLTLPAPSYWQAPSPR